MSEVGEPGVGVDGEVDEREWGDDEGGVPAGASRETRGYEGGIEFGGSLGVVRPHASPLIPIPDEDVGDVGDALGEDRIGDGSDLRVPSGKDGVGGLTRLRSGGLDGLTRGVVAGVLAGEVRFHAGVEPIEGEGSFGEQSGQGVCLPHVPEPALDLHPGEHLGEQGSSAESDEDPVVHVVLDAPALPGDVQVDLLPRDGVPIHLTGAVGLRSFTDGGDAFKVGVRAEDAVPFAEVAVGEVVRPLFDEEPPDVPLVQAPREHVLVSLGGVDLPVSDEQAELAVTVPDDASVDGLEYLLEGDDDGVVHLEEVPGGPVLVEQVGDASANPEGAFLVVDGGAGEREDRTARCGSHGDLLEGDPSDLGDVILDGHGPTVEAVGAPIGVPGRQSGGEQSVVEGGSRDADVLGAVDRVDLCVVRDDGRDRVQSGVAEQDALSAREAFHRGQQEGHPPVRGICGEVDTRRQDSTGKPRLVPHQEHLELLRVHKG